MNVLATHPYSKVVREVTKLEKTAVEDKRMLYLYSDKLVTAYREFPIHEIIDMSFREVGGSGGLLYVHTVGGVFSYTVESSPMEFIHTFKEYVGK